MTGRKGSPRRVSVVLFMVIAFFMVTPQFEGAVATTPDFSISATPTAVIINPGPQGNSTITITSQGFVGRLNMTVSVSPRGLYCQPTKKSFNLTSNSSNSTLLHCGGNPGTFIVNITANGTMSGPVISHQTTVNYVVTDFSISANPSSISLQTGHSASAIVTVSSQQVFSGRVYLNLTLPQGINGSIAPNLLSGPGTATLNVNSTLVGVYNITIVAASGSISRKHWLLVTVTNSSPRSEATLPRSPKTFLYLAVAIAIVISFVVVAASFNRRRQPRNRNNLRRSP